MFYPSYLTYLYLTQAAFAQNANLWAAYAYQTALQTNRNLAVGLTGLYLLGQQGWNLVNGYLYSNLG
jgi:hypothetical protein